MNRAPPTRQRPALAGTGRKVDPAKQTAREGYHGTLPPNVPPDPRDPLTIALDLYAAAERLADMAEDFAAGAFDDRTLSAADALLAGLGRLIAEARTRQAAQGSTP